MSDLPNSITYMTQAIRNGLHQRESFHKFFECWIIEQDHHLQQLVSASTDHRRRRDNPDEADDESVLIPLVQRVIQHYEHYYRAKSRWAKGDVFSMFNPTWRSSLEDAFLWIGGWRPTMAFHLLYSKSGLQFEARLDDLIRGLSTGDLGDLSPNQIERVDQLQKRTLTEEKEISEKLAKQQETVADSSMVELTHAVTELMRNGEVEGEENEGGRVEGVLAPKEEGLVEILERADGLRMKTLREVIGVLSPIQSVYFLIAAAELHLRVHEWGMKRDAVHHHVLGGAGHRQQNGS